MRIRIAEEKDVQAILDVYAPYILNTAVTFEYEVPDYETFLRRFKNITKEFPWLVCEVQGKIAGYAYIERAFERAAYQWDADIAVYIAEEYQQRGIARRFYQCLEKFAFAQGFYRIYALITETNERSCRFHEAMGYRETAVMPKTGYKFGRWHDVMWYEKELRICKGEPKPPCRLCEVEHDTVEEILRSFSAVE